MIQKPKLYVLILSIVIYLLLNSVYRVHIWPDYEDMGFGYLPGTGRSIAALLIFIAYSVFIFLVFKNFLFAFFSIYGLILLAPNLILFHAMRSSFLISLGVCLIPFFVFVFMGIIPRLRWPMVVEKQRLSALWMVIFILFIPFPLTYGLGIDLSMLSLEDVYELRESAAESSNIFTGYFYSSLSTWLIPMAIIYSMWTKRWLFAIIAAMLELYLFLVTGNKITMLILLVVAGFALSKTWHGKTLLFQLGLLVAVLLLFFAPQFKLTTISEDLFLRRFLFHPALLNIQYDEFFGEPLFYSYSFLSWLGDYHFPLPPSKMIGIVYYGSEKGNMTNGVIGDAIINLGAAGIVIIPLLCALVVTYFEKLRIAPVFFALFFLLIHSFMDNAFFTSIVTHGLLLFMIVSGFVLNNTNEPAK